MKAPLPRNEAARLNELHQYEILDTAPEKAFDDLTRLAAHICGTPTAVISLVDTDRQWFKSTVGLDASETPRDVAFCAHAILQHDVFVVPDAQKDIRFLDNPLVTSGPKIQFYAGTPLITSNDIAVGTLCAIDYVARELSPEQKEALEILGRQVVTQLKLRRSLADLEEALLLQRQQSETALREREEEYHRLLDLSSETIAVCSEGKFNYINTTGARLLGAVSPEKIIGKPVLDFVHPDSKELLEVIQQNQLTGNQSEFSQEKLVRLDGQTIDVEVTKISSTYLDKPAIHLTIRNITEPKQAKEALLRATVAELVKQELEKEITERKRVEEGLRTEQEFLSQIIDINPNMIFVKDWEGRFILVNKAFADFYGTTVENIVGKSDANFSSDKEEVENFLRQDREVMETMQRKFIAEEPFTKAITHETHWFQTVKIPLLSSDDTRQVVCVCTDITERRQAEQALQKS